MLVAVLSTLRDRPVASSNRIADTAFILSSSPPVPLDNGKRVMINSILEHLVDRLGEDRVHYAVVTGTSDALPPFPGVIHRLERPPALRQIGGLAHCVRDRSYTIQEAMLGGRRLREQVAALVAEIRPSLEVYDTLRMAQHAPARSPAGRRVLYMDDLFSIRYARMLDVARRGDLHMDPLGGFATNVPARLRPLARRPGVYRPLLRFEGARIKAREEAIVNDFDVSLLVNPREVDQLRVRTGVDSVHVLPPLLPEMRPGGRSPVAPAQFVFLGKLDIPHNDDAICHFLQKLGPVLSALEPAIRIRVIGKNPSPSLRALATRHPGLVRLEGFVEDLSDVLGSTTALLAPLRFGSGLKIKVLEALARGVPVLATSIAAEGLPASEASASGLYVEDDLTAWPALMASLSPERSHAMAGPARAYFLRSYGRDVVARRYDAMLGLAAPAPAPALPAPRSDIEDLERRPHPV
ncbi:glycosyltransferase family 4 protein [Actinomycetospora corticicola]|uniref:Glycosyltransferase involved in cell wall biosynthesis n=1 Tax=Actinomycetospora corticicola TaxID=663602 RepID=A0A7Y9DSA0_9PSEU|nr:glycosyltransferase [Actinomycetospora corticicola]NYD34533.1 glycosyltransferase involved in cell wall biosynthesis [Actinomycetospora corticicola]